MNGFVWFALGVVAGMSGLAIWALWGMTDGFKNTGGF